MVWRRPWPVPTHTSGPRPPAVPHLSPRLAHNTIPESTLDFWDDCGVVRRGGRREDTLCPQPGSAGHHARTHPGQYRSPQEEALLPHHHVTPHRHPVPAPPLSGAAARGANFIKLYGAIIPHYAVPLPHYIGTQQG